MEYLYPTEAALIAVTSAVLPAHRDEYQFVHPAYDRARTALDNAHAKNWLPDWVSERPGRERLYSRDGLLAVAIYFRIANGARVSPSEACRQLTEEIFKKRIDAEFFAIRDGQSRRKDDGSIESPQLFGPLSAEKIAGWFVTSVEGDKPFAGFNEGEGVYILPYAKLAARIDKLAGIYQPEGSDA
ncbi:MAG: hypothetical protein KDA48_04545 [Amphiplicatus sp.]|nr:hypothetical protein [Amphiplicatus sp.]